MTISVLMSVYHSEKADYLNLSLKSVWTDQTHKPDQIVLVEDGVLGKDLLQVIAEWKGVLKDKLVVIVNEKNLGLTKSLNKGIQFCTSDLIARMDSDDISVPDRFEMEVNFLMNHPDIMVVGGDIQEFNSNNEYLSVRKHPRTNEEILHSIYKANPLAHSTIMVRRELFDKGILYDEQYRKNQDLNLWFRTLKAGYKIANLDEILLYFRRDDEMFRRRSRKSAFLEFRIYMKGIYSLYGLFNYYYIYPITRLCFRLMPNFLMKKVYESGIRRMVTNANYADSGKSATPIASV